MPKTGIHWFRNDLRLHDNPSLMACCDDIKRFISVFIFDNKTAGTDICGFIRFRFLLQSLKDLEDQFDSFGIHLMCFYGEPHEIFNNLIQELDVKVISFEKDSESIWLKRDNLVKEVCKKYDVQVIECVSHTLYDQENIFNLNYDSPPNTQEQFKKFCLQIGEPIKPIPAPDFKFISTHLLKTNHLYDYRLHRVPHLNKFNIKPECKEQELCLFPGGETKALQLFKRRMDYEIESFKKGKINPNIHKPILFTEEVSLSPYLRFGCLSVKKFYWDLKNAFDKYYNGPKNVNSPVEQLFWREYFYQLSYKNEKFNQIDGNKMCFKIPWDYLGKSDLFDKWKNGKTGYPWIDACMRQLLQEGWLHSICRNSVAIFLTRGDLFLSWEQGLNVFLKYLIDADWSVCAGNWNWIASGDPLEVLNSSINFCPISYGKKVDPEGKYIRKYLPELKDYPLEYLFEPWKAPLSDQEKAFCIIGKDYPEPCVDHEKVIIENTAKLKQFFNTEKKEIFETFLNDKNVLKPENTEEYRFYTFANFLESEFDDF